jgi:hypothetical protein
MVICFATLRPTLYLELANNGNTNIDCKLFRSTHHTRTRITRPTDATVVGIVLITVRACYCARRTPHCVVYKDQYSNIQTPTCT